MHQFSKIHTTCQHEGICTCPDYPYRWDPFCPTHGSPPNLEQEAEARFYAKLNAARYVDNPIPFLSEEL